MANGSLSRGLLESPVICIVKRPPTCDGYITMVLSFKSRASSLSNASESPHVPRSLRILGLMFARRFESSEHDICRKCSSNMFVCEPLKALINGSSSIAVGAVKFYQHECVRLETSSVLACCLARLTILERYVWLCNASSHACICQSVYSTKYQTQHIIASKHIPYLEGLTITSGTADGTAVEQ